MSDKRKKVKFAAKREKRRLKQLAGDGRLVNGVEIPLGAIAADLSRQVPNNSYSPPPLFYVDKEFTCVDCGREEVWTARQQKWYYEVAKGSLYATAVRCRDCRRKQVKQRQVPGDPNPIKHLGSLMKRVRGAIEPGLIEAGFEFDARSKVSVRRYAWLDYSRRGLILRVVFDLLGGRLVGEIMDENAEHKVVANVKLSGPPDSTSALLERVDSFAAALRDFLKNNRPPQA